jgi:hypothetical protein
LTIVKRGYIGTMSEPATDLPAESEPLTGAAENARRGVVTHITVHGERVAAIVPESLVRLLNDLVALLAAGDPFMTTTFPQVLPQVFPWARSLPPHELKAAARELHQAAAVGAPDAAELIEETLAGWRATAEVYADPAALAALRAPIGDYGPVPEPHAAR